MNHSHAIERPDSPYRLAWLAAPSLALYTAILFASRSFGFESAWKDRPIILVLSLFLASFVLYLLAIRVAMRCEQDRRLVLIILATSLAPRLLLAPSTPIQEVDIYRYLWDGATTSAGISPFRYAPRQVRDATPHDPSDPDLARLAGLRQTHPALDNVLQRVHYPNLPTVYPPVSQAVFAVAAATTPPDATVPQRVIMMKLWLLLFDMGTLGLVLWLLKMTGQPLGLSVIYGWCPLVIKEFANSGHLDAIAVCLTTLAICLVVRMLVERQMNPAWTAVGASFVLALAVGAKLYPIILAPLFLVAVAKRLRWQSAIPAAVFVGATALVLAPMLVPTDMAPPRDATGSNESTTASASDPSEGLKAFLTRWEMNDFLFLILIENLKTADVRDDQTAWFSVVPESSREQVIQLVPQQIVADRWGAAFLVSRCITLIAFAAIAAWLIVWSARRAEVSVWLESAFLTLAWFWLLSPTLNPWYWIWTLPLLPFARNRMWLALSGLVLIYYLRFWFLYHFPDSPVPGTPYIGVAFYDLVITWVEFGPWFLCLIAAWIYRRRREAGQGRAGGAVKAGPTH